LKSQKGIVSDSTFLSISKEYASMYDPEEQLVSLEKERMKSVGATLVSSIRICLFSSTISIIGGGVKE
jgi:hypothetical protein